MKHLYFFFILVSTFDLSAQSWKAEAEQNIRDLRMADIRVSVKNASGAFVNGAKVYVKMKKHRFKWGTTFNVSHISGLEQQGFDLTSNHPYYNHWRHFNSLTPENAAKWKGWLNPASRAKYLEVLDRLNELDIAPRGHTTIWPSISRWNAVPDTVLNAKAIMENGVVVKTKAEVIREIIKGHIEDQLPALAAKGVYELDLVNELVHEGEIVKDLMGLAANERPKEHAQWYKWAKAAAADVLLIANEYDLFQSGNNFHQSFVSYVQNMIAEGAPVDGVGLQGHFFQDIPSYAALKKRLAEVAVLGLPMSITEFDMKQSSYNEMERVLYAIFSEPLLDGFSFWGAWDGRHWRGNAPIYRENWTLKESGKAWFDLVKGKWWTDTTLVISDTAPLETRGFLGEYDLFVEYEGKLISRSFSLESSGSELQINVDEAGFAIPEAQLQIEGNKETVYLNEPLVLSVLSPDSIASVQFFDGDFILAVVSELPFSYDFRTDRFPVLRLSAEVIFQNGFRLRTPEKTVVVNTANARPIIEEVFPPSGSALLFKESIDVYVTASDPNDDPLSIKIYDQHANVLAGSNTSPAAFAIEGLPPGSNTLQIQVEDDKYGLDDMIYVVNLIEDNTENQVSVVPMAADDDVEENIADKSIDITGDLDLGEKITAIRFAFAGIPAEAQVDSAFIQFTSQKGDQTGLTKLIFQGEKSTDALPFSTAKGNVSDRLLTDAGVSWEPPDWKAVGNRGIGERSPDLQPILAELLDQPDWSDQSPVHIIIGLEESPSKRSAFSYDLSAADAPELQVHYRVKLSDNKPAPPDGFSLIKTGENSGTINWQTPALSEEILGFNFFLENQKIPIVLKARSYDLTELHPDTTYTVQARTIGKFGILSDLSAPFSFRLSDVSPVGTRFADRMDQLEVYPNPVGDLIHIRGKVKQLKRLQIFNALGSLVMDIRTREGVPIMVSDLPSGTYILKLWTNNFSQSQITKLIKQ